jgi:hypothetical protein
MPAMTTLSVIRSRLIRRTGPAIVALATPSSVVPCSTASRLFDSGLCSAVLQNPDYAGPEAKSLPVDE